jgi:hypothetical protein
MLMSHARFVEQEQGRQSEASLKFSSLSPVSSPLFPLSVRDFNQGRVIRRFLPFAQLNSRGVFWVDNGEENSIIPIFLLNERQSQRH